MMVMSINLGVVIMSPGVDDLAPYELTLPDRADRHSRPTSATLATAIERLHLPQTRPLFEKRTEAREQRFAQEAHWVHGTMWGDSPSCRCKK
jgi:hypothetical protein